MTEVPQPQSDRDQFIEWLNPRDYILSITDEEITEQRSGIEVEEITEDWLYTYDNLDKIRSSYWDIRANGTESEKTELEQRLRNLLEFIYLLGYNPSHPFTFNPEDTTSFAEQYMYHLRSSATPLVAPDLLSVLVDQYEEGIKSNHSTLEILTNTIAQLINSGFSRNDVINYIGGSENIMTGNVIYSVPQEGYDEIHLGITSSDSRVQALRTRVDLRVFRYIRKDPKPVVGTSWLINDSNISRFLKFFELPEDEISIVTGLENDKFMRGEQVLPEWTQIISRDRIAYTAVLNIINSKKSVKHYLSTGKSSEVGIIMIPSEVFNLPIKQDTDSNN